jgi:hypothetical protein
MKGNLVVYTLPWTMQEYFGIVIESLEGFHVRKSWSDKKTFIDRPMIRIYWINEPSQKPMSARMRILENWRGDNNHLGLSNYNNLFIDEFMERDFEEEWYFPDDFKVINHEDE